MGDDRFSYLHVDDALASHLLDEEDEQVGWDLPDDDIAVPQHLLPSYQDEDDETVLPSASHPSYPYGNPYTSKPLSTNPTSSSNTHHLPQPTLFHHPSTTHSTSLATTLPNLQLRQLFSHTAFGEPRERQWNEMGLDQVVRGAKKGVLREEGEEENEATDGGGAGGQASGDAPAPAGQNAGDHPEEEPLQDE